MHGMDQDLEDYLVPVSVVSMLLVLCGARLTVYRHVVPCAYICRPEMSALELVWHEACRKMPL